MSDMKFNGGMIHLLYKPSLIGKEGENRQLDFDLSTPPALTGEQIDTISKFIEEAQDVLKDTGVVIWVTKGYQNF